MALSFYNRVLPLLLQMLLQGPDLVQDIHHLASGVWLAQDPRLAQETMGRDDGDGELLSVVAGADAFDEGVTGLAVAAASDGRILVLDPVRGQVRTFVRKTRESGA